MRGGSSEKAGRLRAVHFVTGSFAGKIGANGLQSFGLGDEQSRIESKRPRLAPQNAAVVSMVGVEQDVALFGDYH
jgi:hypothetical protein